MIGMSVLLHELLGPQPGNSWRRPAKKVTGFSALAIMSKVVSMPATLI